MNILKLYLLILINIVQPSTCMLGLSSPSLPDKIIFSLAILKHNKKSLPASNKQFYSLIKQYILLAQYNRDALITIKLLLQNKYNTIKFNCLLDHNSLKFSIHHKEKQLIYNTIIHDSTAHTIKDILHLGVNQNIHNTITGDTPSICATKVNHTKTIAWLLKHNANPYIKNKENKTAYDCATSNEARELLTTALKKWSNK